MFSISRGNVLLQFAALSLTVVVALGTAIGFVGQRAMAQKIRESAATTSVSTVRPPLEASLSGVDAHAPLSGQAHERVEEAAAPPGSRQTLAVRPWRRGALTALSPL